MRDTPLRTSLLVGGLRRGVPGLLLALVAQMAALVVLGIVLVLFVVGVVVALLASS